MDIVLFYHIANDSTFNAFINFKPVERFKNVDVKTFFLFVSHF